MCNVFSGILPVWLLHTIGKQEHFASIVERYFWIIIVVFGSKAYWRRAAICVDKCSILHKVHFA
jgi:apolipoprotein N-acyltransferase